MNGMKKKLVSSSHLCLRFYRVGGWTREELEACLLPGGTLGDSADTGEPFGSKFEESYFRKTSGRWDFDKLMPLIEAIGRYSSEEYIQQMTDREYAVYIEQNGENTHVVP